MKLRKHKRDIIDRNWADIEDVVVSARFKFKRNLNYDDMIDKSQFGRWGDICNFLDGVYWPIIDKHHCDGIFCWNVDQNLFDGDIRTDFANIDIESRHNRNKIIQALDELFGYLAKCDGLVDQIDIHPAAYKIRYHNYIETSPKCVQHLADKYSFVKIDPSCIGKY